MALVAQLGKGHVMLRYIAACQPEHNLQLQLPAAIRQAVSGEGHVPFTAAMSKLIKDVSRIIIGAVEEADLSCFPGCGSEVFVP